ncbi:organic cation/carnitine transporter 2-like isoform X2 [Narcine bancroftii]|uniref:organic cation/carnitine transporter 2-like isoform X2 n=1 Tax=Narcine bancroftii TaxID=1343680 RepID=UPI0038314F59
MEVAAVDADVPEVRDYDEVTAFLGEWGPFQKLIFLLLSFSIFPNGFCGLSIIFIGDVPDHRCSIPANLNLSEAWMNRTIPLVPGDDPHYSKCSRYRLDVIVNLSETFPDPDLVNMSGVEQEPCLDGWEYSREQYISTIVSEWDLVCNDVWKSPFSMSIFFAGVLTGSLISGQLSDKFGRKTVLFGTMAVQCAFSILQVISPNWEIYCFLNFLVGLGQISNYVAAFVLGTELLRKSIRILFCTLGVCISYAAGYMWLPLFAYFIRNWRILLLTLSVTGLLYIPLWWFIPESPRWLLLNGKLKEAEEIFRYIAKKNGVKFPDVLFSDFELETMKTKNTQSHSIFHLVKTNNIRLITIINMLLWTVLTIGYYGLSLNTPNLHGNDYLNCFFSAAIEVPAYILSWLLLWKFSRRLRISSILLLGGTVLLLIQVIPPDIPELTTVLVMMGKLAITCVFGMVYVFCTELYPTVIRNTGIGVSSMASRLASILSPYIFYLGMLVLLLPETFNHPLPDTIERMQNIKGFRCPGVPKNYFYTCKKRNLKIDIEEGMKVKPANDLQQNKNG